MSIGFPYRAESSVAMRGHAVHTYASTPYEARESGVTSSITAVTHVRPADSAMRTASAARSLRHCPLLLHTITRKVRADEAACIAANLRLIILSLCPDMSESSPVTGLRT